MAATQTEDVDSRSLLAALGSKYSVEILHATRTPTSAQELSDELDVPIATCYRRIEELVDAGLLKCEGRQLSEEGRRTNVYRRTLDELTVDLTCESPTVQRKERSEAKNRIQDQIDG
ncbi:helix-turn-helix transcriptional regulator [Halostella sp. JP-L12]|uniref:ArsR/SmtB family transcription factor n=1 Tax=Halostella TaxID=1843185 RepID=UPI000EF7B4BD|nr:MULTISPECIES: helix-turn-helix domain-containing protein [Halostella]NHN49555.1 helix-turn-helix transcriptional regulator [Halostella sp. JP-L12]